jgi:lipase
VRHFWLHFLKRSASAKSSIQTNIFLEALNYLVALKTMDAHSPDLMHVSVRGLDFAVWHWPDSGPRILFIHATGFHSRLWDQVVANLPGYDCWAFDMRGHGLSAKPEPPYVWREFGNDVAALMRKIDLTVDLGIGHSMGGHSVALAAAQEPTRFRSLILIDPIIIAPEHYGQPELTDHPVLKRRNKWKSWQYMFERFQGRKPFDTWKPEVLKDYCQYGLLPDTDGGDRDDGGYILACPPPIEGSIYNQANALSANIYADIEKIEVPVLIMHPKTSPSRKTEDLIPIDLYQRLKEGRDLLMPDQTHFIPMEVPDVVATQIQTMVQSL